MHVQRLSGRYMTCLQCVSSHPENTFSPYHISGGLFIILQQFIESSCAFNEKTDFVSRV